MDLILGTGNLQEAAVLLALGTGKAGTKFEGVQDLLAGDGHQAGHIAEGADGLAGLEAPGACVHICADAAAVHDGDVAVEVFDLIEVGIDAVGHKVAQVGLAGADAALAGGGIGDIELGIAHGDLLAQHVVHCAHPLAGGSGHGRVCAVVAGQQLGGDGAIGTDGHLADILEVGAGLGQGDGLAGSIGNLLILHHGVRMAVDEGVETGGVCDDLFAGPGGGRGVYAQMAQTNDVGRTQQLCLVDGLLDGLVQLLAVVAAEDVIDVLGLAGVHEVGRGGLGKGLRGGNAYKCDARAADGEDLDAGQHLQAGAQVHPVAGNIGEGGFLHGCLCAGHAVVELMVAGGGQVVTGLAHQLDDGLAVIHGAIGRALDVIAGVHQQDVLASVHIALLQCSDAGIGQFGGFLVDVGVHIVGVENGNSRLFAQEAIGLFGRCGGCAEGDCGQCSGSSSSLEEAAAGNELFHRK